MQHSSKNNPCPICGRDNSDNCRWSDGEFILCFVGNSFSPPDLPLGAIVHPPGWPAMALCSHDSGFSGASFLFALHRGGVSYGGDLEQARARREKILHQQRVFGAEISKMRKLLIRLQKFPAPEHCTLKQIRLVLSAATGVLNKSEELSAKIKLDRLSWHDIAKTRMILSDTAKQAFYINRDFNSFVALNNLMT